MNSLLSKQDKRTVTGRISFVGDRNVDGVNVTYSGIELKQDNGELVILGESIVALDSDRDLHVGSRVSIFVTTIVRRNKAPNSLVWAHRNEDSGRVFFTVETLKARTVMNLIRWGLLIASLFGLLLFVIGFPAMLLCFYLMGHEVKAIPTREELEKTVADLKTSWVPQPT